MRFMNDGYQKARCLSMAEHWIKLAERHDEKDAWERERGIFVGEGLSPAQHRARTCRETAWLYILEAGTGKQHCNKCFLPNKDCTCEHRR